MGVNFTIHPVFYHAGWKSLLDPYVYPQRLKRFIEFQYRQDRPDLVLSFHIFYVFATKSVCPELPVGYLSGGLLLIGTRGYTAIRLGSSTVLSESRRLSPSALNGKL